MGKLSQKRNEMMVIPLMEMDDPKTVRLNLDINDLVLLLHETSSVPTLLLILKSNEMTEILSMMMDEAAHDKSSLDGSETHQYPQPLEIGYDRMERLTLERIVMIQTYQTLMAEVVLDKLNQTMNVAEFLQHAISSDQIQSLTQENNEMMEALRAVTGEITIVRLNLDMSVTTLLQTAI